jgi:hypothetical protein
LSVFPAPPQHGGNSTRYFSQPYPVQAQYGSQTHLPNSPSSPVAPSPHSTQGKHSQSIDTTAFNLQASLSNLSLAHSSTSSVGRPELTRVVSNGSVSPSVS